MPLFYLDASAIVKRYRREAGTAFVDALFIERITSDALTTSFLSVLEVTSTVYRLLSAGEIGDNTATQILSAAIDVPAIFVSADRDLLRAASEAGLQCLDPTETISLDRLRRLRSS